MSIPVQNIYYLLCYAWKNLDERGVIEIEPIDSTKLVNLFARVLISGTHHLVKRGIDRGYVEHRERIPVVRGRICFTEAMGARSASTGRLPCVFDVLSHDVPHNQILKATLRRLAGVEGLDTAYSSQLARLCRLLSEIQDVELTSRLFSQVQLHRNNQIYDFLLKVCELVRRNLLASEKPGASKFRDFTRDDSQMAVLFEEFVRRFYQLHTAFQVRSEELRWQWIPSDESSRSLLPRMRTDITLTSATRKIVIDCKYTPKATQSHYETRKLRSEHLYQISAYMGNLPREWSSVCEVMLLYPTVDEPFRADYSFDGRRIMVRAINLGQDWRSIHRDLIALVQPSQPGEAQAIPS